MISSFEKEPKLLKKKKNPKNYKMQCFPITLKETNFQYCKLNKED